MHKLIKAYFIIAFTSFVFVGNALAQTENSRIFGSKSGPIVAEAQRYQLGRQHKKAIEKLNKAVKIEGLTPYEVSTIQRMIGASYYSLRNNKKAIRAFDTAIEAGGLLDHEVKTFQANIAQLNIVERKYALGAEQLESYFLEGGPQKPNLIKLIIQAYFKTENYEAAIPWGEKMLKDDIVQTRKEYDTLLFLFDSPEKRSEQMMVANKMVKLWPEDTSLSLQVGLLRGKANKEGVDPVLVTGQSYLLEKTETPSSTTVSNQEAKPIVRIPGIFPANAEKSGHCNFLFDVNREGRVFNIRTVSCTDIVFEKPSIKALKKWRYSPKIISGEAVESKNLENRISFRLRNQLGELIPE
ncbi:energy transducer TonB [Hellea balneolensis]|uniref:energy transducer TonB n=1 Tax=Hellea balneolensis TaxID=287478 RepID=UPI0003F7D44C|nr:energy transducer TonB [Hellea balneolensis]